MSILCIGDPHFSKSRLDSLDLIISRIIHVAETKSPDLIVIMGDLLDSHERSNVYVYDKAISLLKGLCEVGKVVLLIGNHDRPNNSDFQSNLHFFSGLLYWPNLTIIDSSRSIMVEEKEYWFVPYVPPGKFQEAISDLKGKPECIFCHQEFYGVQLGPIKSKKGDKWKTDQPLVISGHIHNYHWLQENILYTGSPYQITYGENDDKALLLINFTSSPQFTRIPLNLPVKITVEIDINDVDKIPQDENVRVVITGDIDEIQMKKKEIQNKYEHVLFRPTQVIKKSMDTKTFKEILYEMVKENEFTLEAYQTIVK